MPMNIRVGEIIRAWRHQKDLSLRTVANEIGIPVACLQRLETGTTQGKGERTTAGVDGSTMAKVLKWILSGVES